MLRHILIVKIIMHNCKLISIRTALYILFNENKKFLLILTFRKKSARTHIMYIITIFNNFRLILKIEYGLSNLFAGYKE